LKLWPSVKIWSLADVKRFALHRTTSSIYEVVIDGQGELLVYKVVQTYDCLVREVGMLLYCASVNIRAPRVRGLMGIDTKWGGFLMTRVPTLFLLSELPWETTPLDDRRRWYEQISDAVHKIHKPGYVWGDVKPENVLIDTNRDACLVDFEGRYTLGWVDGELAETKASDLQGLGRIRSFLKLEP
jgi:tRNA A-37 threonylcarbamoyl transferase component Bud32